jgi:putative transcriptional regulator
MSKSNLTNNIRKLRFENGQMTQQQLADKAGVTRQTIIAIEAGKYAPSLPLAFKIARTFALPIERVFQYQDEGSRSLATGSDG